MLGVFRSSGQAADFVISSGLLTFGQTTRRDLRRLTYVRGTAYVRGSVVIVRRPNSNPKTLGSIPALGRGRVEGQFLSVPPQSQLLCRFVYA